jgi:CHAT domain-containing protein
MVSLWPVDDHATALFMQSLYAAMSQGTAPRKALQLAQQALRRMTLEEIEAASRGRRRSPNAPVGIPADEGGYRHPYFWAPFVLVGR